MVAATIICLAPPSFARNAVVSDSVIASDVGAAVMRAGGNAVDGAVATAFALSVTLPSAGNLGGGGFAVVAGPGVRPAALDFRERAPRLARANMYMLPDGTTSADSQRGLRAAGVPGSVAGLHALHVKYGKLPWKSVVEPAIRLARDGFVVPEGLARSVQGSRALLARFSTSRNVFAPGGSWIASGTRWQQLDLANTLVRIRDRGPDGFYRGDTAERIERTMQREGGLIRKADLAAYRVKWRTPLRGTYRDYTVVTMPPPSSGGVALLQMLEMLRSLPIPPRGTEQEVHVLAEVMKRAFCDRAAALGDPDYAKIPTSELLQPKYVQSLAATIQERATPATEIQSIFLPRSAAFRTRKESKDTTHLSVMDSNGWAVALTTTINNSYGAGVVAEGLGFLWNNEMDDFTVNPGKPNGYGLIQSENNAIHPGKTPLSSMTPTLLIRDGRVRWVLGSPGGPTIINTVLQTVRNLVDYGMPVDEAVRRARMHHQWLPDRIDLERNGWSTEVLEQVKQRGHTVQERSRMGSCHALELRDGRIWVGQDPRLSTSGNAGE
ncbi:MAG: gamma-glutamyltransferase [Fimbriimonadaceae bacterium]|nr:gamma-glutamyltransferase [Fimbriimonadaceae bacterium]